MTEKSATSNTLIIYVNGKEVIDAKINPEWTLLYYLRNKLRLCGTKLACAEGGCGACTVMVSRVDRTTNKLIHVAVNACLTPVCGVHGMAVTTVEGIGSTRTKLHPVQERIAKAHGSQCGFCTPGIVMSMYALLRSIPKPRMEDLEVAFQGNLCRCTGYRPIIEGFRTFTEEWELTQMNGKILNGHAKMDERACAMGDACCKKAFTSEPTEVFDSKEFRPYDPSQEPIFPPKLKVSSKLDEEYLVIKGKDTTWYRPTQLQELLSLKNQFPNAKIIVGNTEVGVEVKFKHVSYPVLINPFQVHELREITETNVTLRIGASVTLNEMEEALKKEIESKPEWKTRVFKSIVGMLHWFAGKQIRNVAAVGGNIMTGSPISDLNPIFLAAGIKLNLRSLTGGTRQVTMNNDFFTGYRRNIVEPNEVLVSIEVPYTEKDQYFVAYKQARRRDDDIAIVNMALNVTFEPGSTTIQKSAIAYGGMAPVTKLAKITSDSIIGKEWNEQLVEFIYDKLASEMPLSGDAPGGMILYRRSLMMSLFFKGFIKISKELSKNLSRSLSIKKELETASDEFHYKAPKSSQYYQLVPKDQDPTDLIGRPLVHASAFKQATGEAVYCDDTPRIDGELYMALVLSTRPHARIVKLDPTKALALEGVVDFICAKNVPKDRMLVGCIVHDEEIFASEKVICIGQNIGAIIAEDKETAQKASQLVSVEYEDISPVVISIEDAIRENSFFPGYPKMMDTGNVDEEMAKCDHVLEGEIRFGSQEHFYLETHGGIAIPKENNEMELILSTQHPTEQQSLIANVLGVPFNKINVRVKRIGGGFGGKETRTTLISMPLAIAANKLQRPVRCILDRDIDMVISGKRHSFYSKYKIGFTKDGRFQALELHLYSNGGISLDLSGSALDRAMFHCENSYKIPHKKIVGYVCKTNLPSNTAFRGFGGPQGMFVAETVACHVADFLGLDVKKISELNLYKEGDITHYNQILEHCYAERCWNECLVAANYNERLEAIKRFNKEHRYRKRGLSIIPTKYGISFGAVFLNQAGALVHIYTDGSVLISHGGIEMGQGLHTKMIQVASRVLKCDPSKIHISETATDKVPNTSATAASLGSDLNGMAVMDACNKLMNRLEPIMKANPNDTWEQWIEKAYFDRTSLSATGFYKTPDIGYSFETNTGKAFNYFTYGTACTEVEIDCLTGDHQVIRTDIVMDLGQSMNPAIDIGQVEGAFVQGYGLFTLEQLVYSPTGMLYSRGPGAYKLPGFTDIPQEFNVSLLKGSSNPRAVYSSKAVGEPPLFLASSVFFAIKEAIKAARADEGVEGYFRLDSPATSAEIRMACIDNVTRKIGEGDKKKPWNLEV